MIQGKRYNSINLLVSTHYVSGSGNKKKEKEKQLEELGPSSHPRKIKLQILFSKRHFNSSRKAKCKVH